MVLKGIIFGFFAFFLTRQVYANVVGVDTQNFNPTTNGLDFVTVHSSETLSPGIFNFGLFVNYAVNTLPVFDVQDGDFQSKSIWHDSLFSSDFNIGYGVLPNWDFGLSIPQMIVQKVEDDGPRGEFEREGITEIRVNSKIRFWGDDEGGIALILSANFNRIEDNPYTGQDSQPTINAEIALDTSYESIALAANIGYRMRNSGKALADSDPILPLENQYIYSVAGSYLFDSIDTKFIAEIFGSSSASDEIANLDRLQSSVELLLGVKYDYNNHLALHLGAGSELQHGLSSPDWRIYAGINYSTGPVEQATLVVDPVPIPPPELFKSPPKNEETFTVHDILFEFDSDNMVVEGGVKSLHALSVYLNRAPIFKKLIIEGHTDSIGSDQYNLDLSKRRAESIKKWLVKYKNLPTEKMQTAGKGEREPIGDNGNYQGRQLNRRVVFKIFR